MSASDGISLDLTVVFVVVVVVAFWNSGSSDVPHLISLAKRYMYNCLNCADAERSFSIYNVVFQTEEGGAAKKN